MGKKTGKPFGRPIGTTKLSSKQLKDLLEAYIGEQKANGKAVTITGFCIYAGISLDTLHNYEHSPTNVPTIKKLRLNAENALVDKLLNENKPVGSIFLLKTRFGYIEQQKMDVTSNGETLGVIALPER